MQLFRVFLIVCAYFAAGVFTLNATERYAGGKLPDNQRYAIVATWPLLAITVGYAYGVSSL
jgi:hypothetical protein